MLIKLGDEWFEVVESEAFNGLSEEGSVRG